MRVANDAIAVLGGSGYMKDYAVRAAPPRQPDHDDLRGHQPAPGGRRRRRRRQRHGRDGHRGTARQAHTAPTTGRGDVRRMIQQTAGRPGVLMEQSVRVRQGPAGRRLPRPVRPQAGGHGASTWWSGALFCDQATASEAKQAAGQVLAELAPAGAAHARRADPLRRPGGGARLRGPRRPRPGGRVRKLKDHGEACPPGRAVPWPLAAALAWEAKRARSGLKGLESTAQARATRGVAPAWESGPTRWSPARAKDSIFQVRGLSRMRIAQRLSVPVGKSRLQHSSAASAATTAVVGAQKNAPVL